MVDLTPNYVSHQFGSDHTKVSKMKFYQQYQRPKLDFRCPVCFSSTYKKIGKHNSEFKLFQKCKLITCGDCLAKSVFPMPSEEALDEFNKSYWNYQSNSNKSREYLYTQALYRLKYLKSHINIKDMSILEIGSGHAYMYDLLKSEYRSVNYSVVETDFNIQNELRSKCINNVYSTWKSIKNSKFDLIILSHVIEHFRAINIYLREIATLLKKGGIMFIEVPNQDDIFKENLGAHLIVFNSSSLKRLFEEINMNVLNMVTVGENIEKLKWFKTKNEIKKNIKRYFPYIVLLKRHFKGTISKKNSIRVEQENLLKFYNDNFNGRWIRAIVSTSQAPEIRKIWHSV